LVYSGSPLGWGLSVKGNHPFPPGNMGLNYFEVEVLDSVDRWCVFSLVRCAPTNSFAGTCALDSAANVSYINGCRAHIATRQLISVMETFESTPSGADTE